MSVTWVLGRDVMPELHQRLGESARKLGHEVLQVDGPEDGDWPSVANPFVMFQGSLGAADQIRRSAPWRPGACCNVDGFACSAWYPHAAEWLVHRRWSLTSVAELAREPERAFAEFGTPHPLFVRPDSPLKPFSGRVIARNGVSLAALDHGFFITRTPPCRSCSLRFEMSAEGGAT